MGRGPDPAVVGAAVRAARQRLGLSLAQLATAAGVSKAAIATLEAGTGNPTLATLAGAADALALSVSDLIEPSPAEPVRVVNGGEGVPLWRDEHGSSARLLLTTSPPAPAEVWSWRLAPGVVYKSHAHPEGITESVTVFSGTLLLTVGAATVEVPAGGAAAFSAAETHAYAASADAPAEFSMTVHLRPARAGRT